MPRLDTHLTKHPSQTPFGGFVAVLWKKCYYFKDHEITVIVTKTSNTYVSAALIRKADMPPGSWYLEMRKGCRELNFRRPLLNGLHRRQHGISEA